MIILKQISSFDSLRYQMPRKVKIKDQPLLLIAYPISSICGSGKIVLTSYLSANEKYLISHGFF